MLTVNFPKKEELTNIMRALGSSDILINQFADQFGGQRLSIHSIQVKYHTLKHCLDQNYAEESTVSMAEADFRALLIQCDVEKQLIEKICSGFTMQINLKTNMKV